ncbi:hypothetical protein MRX96_019425 [Rhipicephalus microplus]
MSESRALWWLLCWTISCLSLQGALCVAIWKLSVPRWVPNGTEEPVLLDCEYVYNEHDVRLVVKWFFNDLLEPVYQWIPELNSRQASGILAGHLDDSSYTGPSQYRALRIIRPTTEMSGLYTCVVSSLAGIDSRQQSMMVYVPARNFTLTYVTTAVPAASPPCRLLPGNGRASTRRCSRRHHFLSGADIEWPLGWAHGRGALRRPGVTPASHAASVQHHPGHASHRGAAGSDAQDERNVRHRAVALVQRRAAAAVRDLRVRTRDTGH